MGIKITYCLFFFMMLVSVATAQKELKVYHTSGKVFVIANGQQVVAVRGSKITKSSSLEVKQSASCMVLESSGRSAKVKSPGVYTYETLQQMIAKGGNDDVSAKFFKYVYDGLFAAKSSENLGITPVVFRGDELMKTPADNTIVVGDAITFTWRMPVSKIPVRLVVHDDANRILVDTILKKTNSFQTYLSSTNLSPGHSYEWKVEEFDTRQPKEHYFHFLIAEKNDAKKILKDMNLLRDKELSAKLKQQMQGDIFNKWMNFYSGKN